MKILEIRSDKGVVKYKAPSVTDRLRLLSKLNITGGDIKQIEKSFDLVMFADIIDHSSHLIVEVDVKIEDRHITSWDDIMYEDECTELIMQFGTALLQGDSASKGKSKSIKK